uniref:Uncharacterized protein n=1 Tax=Arundo donax TaxID=35708 RepID=A0A0A9H089_ARUDO
MIITAFAVKRGLCYSSKKKRKRKREDIITIKLQNPLRLASVPIVQQCFQVSRDQTILKYHDVIQI